MDKNIGKKLDGRYQISELIGIGGMADVYKAVDVVDNKTVAVKILKNEFSDNEEFLRRFRNESKAIAVLSHPNIVKVLDVGFTDKIQFIVMEYIDGITLKEHIEKEGVLKWKQCVHYITQILRALQHAHDRGIVHRDIKPQNIMVFPDGTIKVMDFGIAKFAREEGKTISDKAIGSVHYISPEQARGDVTDEKSDIYSVGIMMYEMLSGTKPFDGNDAVAIALMHMKDIPERPTDINDTIPEGLEEIVLRAIEKDAAKRYQSASEMIKDIDRFKADPRISFGYYSDGDSRVRDEDNSATKFFTPIITYDDDEEYVEDFDDDDDEDTALSNGDEEDEEEYEETASVFVPILTGVAIVVILVAVIFIVALISKNLKGTSTPEIVMPDLINMQYTDAVTEYPYLKLVPGEPEYSDYEEGVIFFQDINAGRPIKSGITVNIKVSKGKRIVDIPDVSGYEYQEAQNVLIQYGFDVRTSYETSEEVAEKHVIRTEPAANTQVAFGSTVTIVYSQGSTDTHAKVPDVSGLQYDEAVLTLEKNGFKVTRKDVDSVKAEGIVVGQSVEKGKVLEKGKEIELSVSNGNAPEMSLDVEIEVPDGAKGKFRFTLFDSEGVIIGEKTIDELKHVSGKVRISVAGTDTVNATAQLTNVITGQSGVLGKYKIDFTRETYYQELYDRDIFEKLGAIVIIQTTTPPPETTVSDTTATTIDPGAEETTISEEDAVYAGN